MPRPVSGAALIGAVVSCLGIGAALVVGLSYAPHGADSGSTPLATTMISTITFTLVALLALLRADQSKKEAERINGDVSDLHKSLKESQADRQKLHAELDNLLTQLKQEGSSNG
jgi:uncharacterized protein YlxW (UPF0749 family)